MPNEEVRYTRDGSFKLSVDFDEAMLVTSEGYIVLSEDEDEIFIESGLSDITIDDLGYITGLDEEGEIVDLGRIGLFHFTNPEGLVSEGQNLYSETVASGEPLLVEAEEMSGRMFKDI